MTCRHRQLLEVIYQNIHLNSTNTFGSLHFYGYILYVLCPEVAIFHVSWIITIGSSYTTNTTNQTANMITLSHEHSTNNSIKMLSNITLGQMLTRVFYNNHHIIISAQFDIVIHSFRFYVCRRNSMGGVVWCTDVKVKINPDI